MKILITGMNKNQCVENFYLRQQLKVIPSHYSLIHCLRDMGHTVEQRMVSLGEEDLSEYDKVIVFLAGPRQLVAVTFYRALFAIAHLRSDQLILAFDDWQTKGIFDGIASCKDPEKMFAKFILGVNSVELSDVAPYAAVFQDAVDIILAKKAPVLLSCFDGGDPTLLIDYPREKLFTYNPNPYHHNRRPGDRGDTPGSDALMTHLFDDDEVHPGDKKKAFNFASLVQSQTKKWLKKQNVKEWPIHFYGSKADGQDRLTEGEMVKVFSQHWGCLMPGYPHAGSGWWRARPLQVADAGSILIGDPKEMYIYYQDDRLANLTAGDVEAMDLTQLSTTAALQAEALYSHHPLNQQHQRNQIQAVLEA